MDIKYIEQERGNIVFGSIVRHNGKHYLYLDTNNYISLDHNYNYTAGVKQSLAGISHFDVLDLGIFPTTVGTSFLALGQVLCGLMELHRDEDLGGKGL